MASNPPGKCCTLSSFHEGTSKGKHVPFCGLETYVTGEDSDRTVVILTDIYGSKYNNVLLVADEIAKCGYKVYIPDILKGDPVDGSVSLDKWLPNHTNEITKPIVDDFLAAFRKEVNPKFLGVIGYCFGAKYAIQQISASGHADAAAVAHPSFVSIEEVAEIKKPIIISAAEEDSIFPPELRHQTEAKLAEIGARYQIDLFSGVSHGFAVRGDILNPVVKYAKEKALADQLQFFALF